MYCLYSKSLNRCIREEITLISKHSSEKAMVHLFKKNFEIICISMFHKLNIVGPMFQFWDRLSILSSVSCNAASINPGQNVWNGYLRTQKCKWCKQMGRQPEFEDLPNWWWVVYHFFPLQYQLAWTWRLPKPGHALHAWTEGTPERGALWSEEQERDLLRVREGGRNSRVFFPPFSLSRHPGRTTLVAAVTPVAAGQALKTERREPFSP